MSEVAAAPVRREGPGIGPVATDLLFENEHVKVWHMDRGPGETFWNHYHDFDYVLFITGDMLGTVHDATADHDRVWRARADRVDDLPDEQLGSLMHAHSVHYIPGDGFLSPGFANIGDTRFLAGLVEVKRPRRADQGNSGYVRTDALVGLPARSGSVLLLENDRVRVHEIALDPGESTESRDPLDLAAYVVDGGTVRIDDASGTIDVKRPSLSGYWLPASTSRRITNVGPSRYRELSVELK